MAPDGQCSRLRVTVTDERGRAIARGLAEWLGRAAPRRACGAVNVALVSDARVRALNRTYRRKDYATDVLSFPSQDFSPQRPQRTRRSRHTGRPPSAGVVATAAADFVSGFLGDIVIARG